MDTTRLSGSAVPEPGQLSGPPEPDSFRGAIRLKTAATRPPDYYDEARQVQQLQQGRRMARYIGDADTGAGLAPGSEAAGTTQIGIDVSRQEQTRMQPTVWQGWNSHSLQAQSAQPVRQEGADAFRDAAGGARRNEKAAASAPRDPSPVASGKRTVISVTRREMPLNEAREKGILTKQSEASTTGPDIAPTQDSEKKSWGSLSALEESVNGGEGRKQPPQSLNSTGDLPAAGLTATPMPASTPKVEIKTNVYGADAQRADVMEARKRAYQLTSEIASERTENARLREVLRQEKSKAREAARASKKLVEGLQRQAVIDEEKLDTMRAKLVKFEGHEKRWTTETRISVRESERAQRECERQKALDAGTIDALRREVKKLLVQLQDHNLRENKLEEQAVTLKERLRSQTRITDTLNEDLQNVQKEHAAVLKKLGDEGKSRDKAASAEGTIREQQLKIDDLQQQLHYLALENEYPQTAKMEEEHEEKMRALETELCEAGDRLVKLEDEKNTMAGELAKSREIEQELKQKLLQHSTVLTNPRDSQTSVFSAGGYGPEHLTPRGKSAKSLKAVGVRAPLPDEVLLEVKLSTDLQNLTAIDLVAYKEGLAEHIGKAIEARMHKVRVLGLETALTNAPDPVAVLHLALQYDVCFPFRSALDAGRDAVSQLSDPSSRLRQGELGRHLAGISLQECSSQEVQERGSTQAVKRKESPMSTARSFRSGSLSAEDFEHCGSDKCSAMIQGLNRQLEDALAELAQVHNEAAYKAAEMAEAQVKEYRDTINKLHEEAAQRRSYLNMTQTSFQNNDTMINEQDAALAQMQARLQDALGRLARRENEEKLRLSELVGELEHLKLWQVGGARDCCGSGRRQMPQEQHLCVLAYLIGIVGVEWRDG